MCSIFSFLKTHHGVALVSSSQDFQNMESFVLGILLGISIDLYF